MLEPLTGVSLRSGLRASFSAAALARCGMAILLAVFVVLGAGCDHKGPHSVGSLTFDLPDGQVRNVAQPGEVLSFDLSSITGPDGETLRACPDTSYTKGFKVRLEPLEPGAQARYLKAAPVPYGPPPDGALVALDGSEAGNLLSVLKMTSVEARSLSNFRDMAHGQIMTTSRSWPLARCSGNCETIFMTKGVIVRVTCGDYPGRQPTGREMWMMSLAVDRLIKNWSSAAKPPH
jgi:hypothetical protein